MKKYLIVLLLSVGLYAQGMDGIGLSLGGNYAPLSRGVHALAYNPANIAVPRNNVLELNLLGMNVNVANNSFSYHTYRNFFVTDGEENYWDQKKKDAFLGLIPDDGLKINTDVNLNVLGLAFNNFALAIHPIAFGRVQNKPLKKILDLALNGDEITRDYGLHYPNALDGSSFAAIGVSLGYAYPIPVKKYFPDLSFLYAGVGVNYYIALGVVQIEEAQAHLQRTQFDHYETVDMHSLYKARVSYPEEATPAGKGRSFNLGLSGLYKDRWFVSLSFMNIAGKLQFSTNTERIWGDYQQTITIYDNADSSEYSQEHSIDTTMTIEAFSTEVPAFMHLGLAYYFKKNLVFTSEWRQGLNKAFGNSTVPRVGFGVQYKPLWWLPLRSGVSFGGNTGFLLGMGFGLDFRYMSLDFSYAMKNALWPTHSEGLFLGLNFMIRI